MDLVDRDIVFPMPFDVNGWKQCGFKTPPMSWQRVPLAKHAQAYATLKAGASKAKYAAAFDAVKAAYQGWEKLAAGDKQHPDNKSAHAKFLAIGKAEYNAIYLGMQKYNGTLLTAIAQRQNALSMLAPWNKEFSAFSQLTPQLMNTAKAAWAKKDKALAAKVITAAAKADKRQWIEQCYQKYKASTEPWRTAKTGLDANDMLVHILPLTNKIYAIGKSLNAARNLIADFTAAWNTAKGV